MNSELLWAILASLTLLSAASLLGAVTLLVRPDRLARVTGLLVGFAFGALLATAGLHLLPDAAEALPHLGWVVALTAGGMVLFWVVERLLARLHRHAPHDDHALVDLAILGDGLHNFFDGALIAGSYLTDPAAGAMVTLLVLAHELPQELADVGLLLAGGLRPRQVVWTNLLVSLTAFAGAGVVLGLGLPSQAWVVWLTPVIAGGFLYLAWVRLWPRFFVRVSARDRSRHLVMAALGVGLIWLLNSLMHVH
jgi:zinc and cadmium transporter